MNSLEEAFYKRYNRKATVNAEKKENVVSATIKYRDAEFVITETMDNGLTKYVDVIYLGKKNRFKRYIDAEIYIADKIGEL